MIPSGFVVDHHDVVTSTQNVVRDRLSASGWDASLSGLVISADHQSAGRGRQGRPWETRAASGNLAATLAWHIGPTENPGDYSLIVAVAMAGAFDRFLADPSVISIKWPNDILLGNRKACGILIERPEPNWILIGTGVNVAQAPDDRARLYDFVDDLTARATARDVLAAYLNQFQFWVQVYRRDGLAPICAAWMDRAHGVGQGMSVRLPHETFSAVFRGLAPDGAARAELPDGSVRLVYSGEVFFG